MRRPGTDRCAWRKLLKRHVETPRFAVISYGKLGGKELGYASDLDLVFLFDDPAPEAGEIYARLGTRLNTWLSAHTSAGQLFETDLRLRPNGDSGLVVSSIEAFRQYQLESAWVWEHQALTRARFSPAIPPSAPPSSRSAARCCASSATSPSCARKSWRCGRRCSTRTPRRWRSATQSSTSSTIPAA